jgi:hypothetical protein
MNTNNIEVRNIVRPILFIAIGVVIGVIIAVTTIVPRQSGVRSISEVNRHAVSRTHTSTDVASRVVRHTGVMRVVVRDAEPLNEVELEDQDAVALRVVNVRLV